MRHIRVVGAIAVVAVGIAACSGGTVGEDPADGTAGEGTATTRVTTTSASTTTSTTVPPTTVTTTTEPAWPFPSPPGVVARADGWSASILYAARSSIPSLAAVAPDGRIFFTSGHTSEGLEIRELLPDGSSRLFVAPRLTAFALGGKGELHDFGFDPDGRLLIGPLGHPIYVVDTDTGELEPLTEWPGVKFLVRSDGTIVSIDRENRLWLTDPATGATEEYVFDFKLGWGMAVGPNDQIAVVGRTGELYDVTDPSTPRLLADDLPGGGTGEDGVPFTPDGRLFWVGLSVVEVDFDTGAQSDQWRIRSSGDVKAAPDGTFIVWHPNEGITRVTPDAQTEERLYAARLNTSALAIFDGTVYAAFQNGNGSTDFSIEEGGKLVPVADFDMDAPAALAIDASGRALLSGLVRDGLQMVDFPVVEFSVTNPEDAVSRDELGGCPVFSIAVDRADGTFHLANCEGVTTVGVSGSLSMVPYPADVNRGYIAAADGGGPVYMVGWSSGTHPSGAEPHELFALSDGEWTEIVDMADAGLGRSWAVPATCPDGSLYVIAHDPSDEQPSGNNSLWEINTDGSQTPLLAGVSTDAFALECDGEGRWLASTGIGVVYRLERP